MDIREMDKVDPSVHWYYRSKSLAIRNSFEDVSASLVDVGAGSGFFSKDLLNRSKVLTAILVDPGYQEHELGVSGNTTKMLVPEHTQIVGADSFLFLDVLEHVDNDLEFLEQYVREAPIGSLFVLTVPAFMSLWSDHDVFLEHRRRYRLNEIVAVVESSGLVVTKKRYLFGSIFPLVWIFRKLRRTEVARSQMRPMNRFLNDVLYFVCQLEHQGRFKFPFGVSAMVVARKQF
jgi:hypothetical protein